MAELSTAIDGYIGQVAKLNNTATPARRFTVVPSVQQTMEKRIQEKSDFLKQINNRGVDSQTGEKIGVGVRKRITGNTDTASGKERTPSQRHDLSSNTYECRQNNQDTALRYSEMDAWAHEDNFQKLVRDSLLEASALDIICIGFNGREYAKDSDIVANPNLEDVNIGWCQKYRNDAPERVMSEGVENSGKINVYPGGDYENLDAIVTDAVDNLIAAHHQERTDLVAIVGRKLLSDKYFPLINKDQENSEKLAGDIIISQKRLGGLPAMRVPFVPEGMIFIQPLKNLSRYWLRGSRRRKIIDNPALDQLENYESSADDYVVEDYEAGCLIENINTTKPAP